MTTWTLTISPSDGSPLTQMTTEVRAQANRSIPFSWARRQLRQWLQARKIPYTLASCSWRELKKSDGRIIYWGVAILTDFARTRIELLLEPREHIL